jgi:predicted ArsR family transcriptional regulator
VADYQVAYELAAQVLTDTLSDLRSPLKEAYERIGSLCHANEGSVSRREIRQALSVPDSTARRWLSELVELEYLTITEGGRQGAGKVTRYALTDRGPQRQLVQGLLRPEELSKTLKKTATSPKNRHSQWRFLSPAK